jgi:hypothetical protein
MDHASWTRRDEKRGQGLLSGDPASHVAIKKTKSFRTWFYWTALLSTPRHSGIQHSNFQHKQAGFPASHHSSNPRNVVMENHCQMLITAPGCLNKGDIAG